MFYSEVLAAYTLINEYDIQSRKLFPLRFGYFDKYLTLMPLAIQKIKAFLNIFPSRLIRFKQIYKQFDFEIYQQDLDLISVLV